MIRPPTPNSAEPEDKTQENQRIGISYTHSRLCCAEAWAAPPWNPWDSGGLVALALCAVARLQSGGRSTKIHAAVDALGNPIELMLTTGNTNDITVAEKLLAQIKLRGSTVLADRAYGKWELREYIANHDADFCIPPKANDTDSWYVDRWHYKERHLVETFFLKLKEYRRVKDPLINSAANLSVPFAHLFLAKISIYIQ